MSTEFAECPVRAEEGDWIECEDCDRAGTDACNVCSDADLYEPSAESLDDVQTLLRVINVYPCK